MNRSCRAHFWWTRLIGTRAGWRRWAAASASAELGILAGGLRIPRYQAASISRDSGREKFIDVSINRDSWLVISESYMPGWRAFARPFGAGEEAEFGLGVRLVLAICRALNCRPASGRCV